MRLDSITTITAGHPFRGSIQEVHGSGRLAVQMRDTTPIAGINWASCLHTELPGKKSPDWLREGDILIAARGNHYYAVLVDAPPMHAVATPHFFVVRCQHQGVLPAYLAWLLNQQPCQHFLQQHAEGTASKSIRLGVLAATPVAVPPLPTQQAVLRIATTLRQEQLLAEQLLRNGETLLTSIACDLLKVAGHPTR